MATAVRLFSYYNSAVPSHTGAQPALPLIMALPAPSQTIPDIIQMLRALYFASVPSTCTSSVNLYQLGNVAIWRLKTADGYGWQHGSMIEALVISLMTSKSIIKASVKMMLVGAM